MKKFVDVHKPMLISMVTETELKSVLAFIANSLYGGADAIGFGLGFLKPEYRTEAELDRIFAACAGKPVYLYSYPEVNSAGFTHEQCAEYLLFVAKCASKYGAVLCDIMCDMFDKNPSGWSDKPEAVKKQTDLAKQIHDMGCEVLYSVHHSEFLGEEEIIRQARAQIERGADVVKIVAKAGTREELIENLDIITKLKESLGAPFLYLANGKYSYTIRQIGIALGVSMCLCVEHYNELTNKVQPALSASRAIRDNLIIVE